MTRSEKIKETVGALDDLLEDERDALLAGALDRIADLHDRKTELIETLHLLDLQDQQQLSELSQKLDRNQALLSSALDGIRSVAQRLAAVRQVRENLDTYGSDGQRKSVKTKVEKSLEKRA